MPPKKPSHLHKAPKGKPTSIEKPTLGHEDGDTELSHEESVKQYQLELLWCIQQLEKLLQNKPTEKSGQEAWKALQILKNNNQPIIRKRQLMRQHFGDYRAKMLAEEKKLVKKTKKPDKKVEETDPQPAKMLIFFENGEQRLITFTMPRDSCTLQDILEQVNVDLPEGATVQCMQNTSSEIDYYVAINHTTKIEDMLLTM